MQILAPNMQVVKIGNFWKNHITGRRKFLFFQNLTYLPT